jgi:hypothetical protein
MSLEDLSMEARDELALLARQLSENPATRKEFLRLTKRHKPEMTIPELDIEDKTDSAIELMRRENQELRSKWQEKEAMEELEKRRSRLKMNGLVNNDDDVAEVEKLMLEKGMTDHKTAAEYWSWMKQSAQPTPSGYNPNPMSKFDLGKYWKNPVQGARDEASKALAELRKTSRPIGI